MRVTHISYLETYVDQGVIPEGSTWSMNPIPPRCLASYLSALGFSEVLTFTSLKYPV